MSAFILRLNERLDHAMKNDIVGIGWAECDQLGLITDWDGFKQHLASKYTDYQASPRALGNAAGSCWRFIHDIGKNDLIVIPVQDGFLAAETTEDNSFYSPEHVSIDFAWRRNIKWLISSPIPRSHADNLLRRRLKARQTCVEASDLIDPILKALEQKSPLRFAESVKAASMPIIYEKLATTIDDLGLEKLVALLASANGATATVQAKQQHSTGDFDVIATHDLCIANEEASIKVAYQVKQHEGVSGSKAVQQLIDRLLEEDASGIHICVVVSTAEEFSQNAQELAKNNDIVLIDRKGLAEWIMDVGLEKLQGL